MRDIVKEYQKKFRRNHQRARRYTALLLALALTTCLFVNWQLHGVGIAKTAEYLCGELEHEHTAACYEKLGFRVVPAADETRHDIIQAVELGSREGMVAFCKGIQSAAPVDSYVTPEPWAMPGYDSEVIMAAGAFVQGSSIELSADGPIRPPYAVYFQGGLTWYHAKLGILMSLQKMLEAGLISL